MWSGWGGIGWRWGRIASRLALGWCAVPLVRVPKCSLLAKPIHTPLAMVSSPPINGPASGVVPSAGLQVAVGADTSTKFHHRWSPVLHTPVLSMAHTWRHVAAAWQTFGPRAVHSRTASRVGVSGWRSHDPWEKWLKVTHVTQGTKKGHVTAWPGGRMWAPLSSPEGLLSHSVSPPPPFPMDATARCHSVAVAPTWGTATSLSQATGFSRWRLVAQPPGELPRLGPKGSLRVHTLLWLTIIRKGVVIVHYNRQAGEAALCYARAANGKASHSQLDTTRNSKYTEHSVCTTYSAME